MKDIIAIIGVLIFFIIWYHAAIYEHEKVHKTIFEHYGIKSRIEVGFFQGVTIPETAPPPDVAKFVILANAIHESISYAVVTLSALIVGLFIILLVAIQEQKGGGDGRRTND